MWGKIAENIWEHNIYGADNISIQYGERIWWRIYGREDIWGEDMRGKYI